MLPAGRGSNVQDSRANPVFILFYFFILDGGLLSN